MSRVRLTCHIGLDQVCPDDTLQCTCTSTGPVLTWRTSQNGVFNGTGIEFSLRDPVGTSFTNMGFTVTLIKIANGNLTSIMTFTPTAVSSSGITVTCKVPSLITTTSLAVTSAGICILISVPHSISHTVDM